MNQQIDLRLDGVRVLVVDDEPDIRALLCEELESCGASVREAGSGNEVVALLEAGERFEAVISDIRMRGGDGIVVVEAVRRSSGGEHVFVALVTGYSEIEAVDAVKAGASAVFGKPFALREILEAIHTGTRKKGG